MTPLPICKILEMRVVTNELVKMCLERFAEIAEKEHDIKKLYTQFGKCLKLGVHEDSTNRIKVAELMRDHGSKSGEELISFKEDADGMKNGLNDIYFIIGDSTVAVSSSPFLESFCRNGLEVL